jgi:dihydrofolate reductase
VITGRKNYESIPARFRPLRDRVNIVVTRDSSYTAPGALVVGSLEAGIELARKAGEKEVFIIGGGQLFAEAFEKRLVERLYLTTVHGKPDGDVHFPDLGKGWKEVWSERHEKDDRHAYPFTFKVMHR